MALQKEKLNELSKLSICEILMPIHRPGGTETIPMMPEHDCDTFNVVFENDSHTPQCSVLPSVIESPTSFEDKWMLCFASCVRASTSNETCIKKSLLQTVLGFMSYHPSLKITGTEPHLLNVLTAKSALVWLTLQYHVIQVRNCGLNFEGRNVCRLLSYLGRSPESHCLFWFLRTNVFACLMLARACATCSWMDSEGLLRRSSWLRIALFSNLLMI